MHRLSILVATLLCTIARADPCVMFGAATHFGMKSGDARTLPMLAGMAFASLRDEVYWSDVEAEPGHLSVPVRTEAFVDAAVAAGVAPLLVLDYGNPAYDGGDKPRSDAARSAYRRYAEFVVAHFRGRVSHYEIWNEWDIAIGDTSPGEASDFVALVHEVIPALRKVDPSARYIVGAVTPEGIESGWLRRAVEAGLLRDADALAVHTYNYRRRDGSTPEAWHERLSMLERQIATWRPRSEPAAPPGLYVTEMGWPNHIGRGGIGAPLQAAYAVRLFLLAPGIASLRGIWWYTWQDEGISPFDAANRFGLIDTSGRPKAAAIALAEVLPWLGHVRTVSVVTVLPAPWISWTYILDDGRRFTAIWRGDDSEAPILVRHARRSPGGLPEACRALAVGDALQLRIGAAPCILQGGADEWVFIPS